MHYDIDAQVRTNLKGVENHKGTYLSSQKNVTLAYLAASVMKEKSFKALKFVLW
jgi:hypothetical protein